MTIPKVSVIIPVYKVEKYIGKCAESLFNQTLKEIEYIFIDDCSPDSSIKELLLILQRFPQREEQVRIIHHKENRGVSKTRQEGIEIAIGEYIIHCDPDDWVDESMYERMYKKAKANSADIVICNMVVEENDTIWIRKNEIAINNIECAQKMLLDKIHCATWNKLIRADLYKNQTITFPADINLWEDFCTIIPLVLSSNKILFIEEAFYHYRRINPLSYTLALSDEGVLDIITAIAYVQSFIGTQNAMLVEALLDRKLKTKLNLLLNTSGNTQKLVSTLYPEIRRKIWNDDMSVYWKLALYVNEIFGLEVFNIFTKLRLLFKR